MLVSLTTAQAQTPYKKRVLFYGPTLGGGADVFVNDHPDEFEPVDIFNPEDAPGKSQIWFEQKWINATVADFQQFDAIVISDQGNRSPFWNAALATKAIWGSAISGNIFITSGDPIADNFVRPFRQGIRFAATQAGNAHGRTGLYVALDHFHAGENLGAVQNGIQAVSPTELPILSWFGGFRAITIPDPGTALRLVAANSILNAMEQNIGGWVESQAAGFHTWPSGFYPVAQMLFDNNPTPTNNSGYFAPCEADTGYKACPGVQPLVYMLVRPVTPTLLSHLKSAQCNIAINVGQTCAFSAYSTTVPDENPNNPSGPSTQVRWRVLSGPNANRTGACVRQTVYPGIPTGIWNGSYANQGTVTANNFQDVVQLFLDYDNDGVFDEMVNNNTGDPNDPNPGVTIDFGTTFTVNWASITPSVLTKVTITNLLSPSAAVETPSDATFRLTRTGTPTSALEVKICVSGTANGDAGFGDVDYELRVGSTPFQILLISGGETTVTIPAGLTTLDIVLF